MSEFYTLSLLLLDNKLAIAMLYFSYKGGFEYANIFHYRCFVLDDKGVDRLIKIIENNKIYSVKKIYKSNKYEEGKKAAKPVFPS